MNTLQISPLGGVVATPALTGSPVSEASRAPHSASPPPDAKLDVKPLAPVVHAPAAASSDAAPAAPVTTLKVGLVAGTFDVFVDLVDQVAHRTLARLFGPSQTSPGDAGTKSVASASQAYAKSGSSSEPASSVHTEA